MDNTKRDRTLVGRTSDFQRAVLAHPKQAAACSEIATLLAELRALPTGRPGELHHQFQAKLVGRLVTLGRERQAIGKQVARTKAGRVTPEPPSGDWAVELEVAKRVERQLRSVGDALAWRVFGFDRRYIIVLCRNDWVGAPLSGKDVGLETELERLDHLWSTEGTFGLYHDVTNALRIGDVTTFPPEGPPAVEEVKTNISASPSQAVRRQRDRLNEALATLHDGAPLAANTHPQELYIGHQALVTDLEAVRTGLVEARGSGVSCPIVGDQRVVECYDLTAPGMTTLSENEWAVRKAVATNGPHGASGLDRSSHQLRAARLDQLRADPRIAPFTIFPFSPETCAKLTCDRSFFATVMGWDGLERALCGAGLAPECLMKPESGVHAPEDPVFRVALGDSVARVSGLGVHQFLFEVIQPEAFANLLAEILAGDRALRNGVYAFASESAVWV